ncbi:MAG: aminomethyl-transferring glycine dehydrogenase subunit GcvPA [Gammaproteobacteria bacterium]|nr:MAG: aminomethyl-transferring glycine dehydrogenase subunit GcvPA [Gammaproteobacteria bacterium]
MPYIPHTESDVQQMLASIGVSSIEQLFDEIPAALKLKELHDIPEALPEMQVTRLMQERASQDAGLICFAGGGAYEHHIPAPVWEIAARGEFYSAYTPYQAEASQGTLQLIYEYQSMMTRLLKMDASNASLYDGASALAEAVLMAVRANRRSKSRKILVPASLHPVYLEVCRTIVQGQSIELEQIAIDEQRGTIDPESLNRFSGSDIAALVIPQPNYFGMLESVDALSNWAHENGALVIAQVNPLAMALLTPPGDWGEKGADIACGEGQPLGVPLSSGGPYFGFMCCRQDYIRQMPGRIVGQTVDLEGKRGFTLTLQAREQHIRRSKATSNICTNQGLMVTAATIYMALMGGEGLQRVAQSCHANLLELRSALEQVDGVEFPFSGYHFHELAYRTRKSSAEVLEAFEREGILGGVSLRNNTSDDRTLLVCTTEMRNSDDIRHYVAVLEQILRGE